ncbi:alpha/beta hydrolase [Shewanella sp. 1CM18E]|uniref:alpha/beta fold hydrolase n=1 Tax=Shewanella sp. 1CM18E TaxID=2929169 RepID=UPI0020BD9B9A|nr:alpha/beta hydrolase [Shewanella sp. 1CM18E]MCK8044283.1 alpha/beta hydrolase [Shewanella sp. 1CM18E]
MLKRIGLVVTCSVLLLVTLYLITPSSILVSYMINAERSLSGLKVHKLKIDELDIEYLRGGSGTPLVLLHGFGADKDNWNRIANYLTAYFDVIAIDLPGFGNSTDNIELDYDLFSQVTRLSKTLDALNITEFNLAGSSMGGYIAGNFAAKYPSKVKNLWLISPFGVVDSEKSEMFLAIKNGYQPMVLPRNEAEFTQLVDFLFVEPPYIPSPIVSHLAKKAEQRLILNTKIYEQIHRMRNGEAHPDSPLDQVLKSYNGPVLVTWGQADRVLHVSGATKLKDTIPHAQVDIMAQVGHLPMIEAPKETASTFIAFALKQ